MHPRHRAPGGGRPMSAPRVARTKAELRALLATARDHGRTVGLVPTMGSLHDGHLSLLRAARERCDVVVMSLFVNPAQFGEGEDLDSYPRDEVRDLELAGESGVDIVFAPERGRGLSGRLRDLRGGRGPRRRPRRRSRPARRDPLPRRHDGRREAAQPRGAGRRVLRPEGRAAGDRYPADGSRPGLPVRDRRGADGARARRPRAELAQFIPDAGRARARARVVAGARDGP